MEKELMREIVAWDVCNWSKAIDYWEKNTNIYNKEFECLELGASKGGLSLWLALNNNKVLCTDLNGPERVAYQLHEKYNCSSGISYDRMDATNITYSEKFDVIVFKSILGGISNNKNENKAHTIKEIYKALKPGGILLFAENLEATYFHKVFRNAFGTKNWNYLKLSEIDEVFSFFSKVKYTTTGFFGCFGRTESQRVLLGKVDTFMEKVIPEKSKYILIGIAVK